MGIFAPSPDQQYNGWSNWETWNLALWIGNDETTYYRFQSFLEKLTPQNAEAAEAVTRALLPNGTPSYGPDGFDRVDWAEIRDLLEELV